MMRLVALLVCTLVFATRALAATPEERCAAGEGYDAITACSDVIGIGTGGAEIAWAYFDRARAYFGEKLYASAISDLTESLKRKPDDAEALENQGIAFAALGDYAHAVSDYDHAIDLQPNVARMYRERCSVRAASGHDLDDALDDCNKALSLKADDVNALDARGFVQFRDKNYAAAIADCTAALSRNPQLA